MSEKYGTVLLFYTGIVVLVLLMASGIERYQNRALVVDQSMGGQSGQEMTANQSMEGQSGQETAVDQGMEDQSVQDGAADQGADDQSEQQVETNKLVDTQLDVHTPRIALTFDDGPSYYTEDLLDGLQQRGVLASFFLVGGNIEGKEDVLLRMYEEGHLIGNHTYDHVQLTSMSTEAASEQISKTQKAIYDVTGYNTIYVRPPYGLWQEELEYCVTMIPVLWDIDPEDWTTSDVDGIVKKVVSSARDGGIILLHDNYDSSVQAALRIVDELQSQGYCFVTVDELLDD